MIRKCRRLPNLERPCRRYTHPSITVVLVFWKSRNVISNLRRRGFIYRTLRINKFITDKRTDIPNAPSKLRKFSEYEN